jgi:hypothetical protein
MQRADPPTTASLMGYPGVVKPATTCNLIVMKALNAQRGWPFAHRGFYRLQRYVAGKPITESGKLTNA